MKEYASDKIRNVAVLSHDGAGKTAVVESLLLACGAVDAVGVGKDNKHIMDFEPDPVASLPREKKPGTKQSRLNK